MNNTETMLEFDRVRQMLCDCALSMRAKKRLEEAGPVYSERECRRLMDETTQARRMLDACGSPPLPVMEQLEKTLALCRSGAMLSPEQLGGVMQFLASCRRVRTYLRKTEPLGVPMASWANGVQELPQVYDEIDRCIRGERVEDAASPALRDLRRRIETARGQIHSKLAGLLRSKKQWFSDGAIVSRNGRLVLPVRRECKNQVPGTVVDVSGTGGTVFIEPAAVAKARAELTELEIAGENEVRRVLYTLTALVDDYGDMLRGNAEAMEALDVVFARAKLSAQMDAIEPALSAGREIVIRQGRHPLLRREECVPLDFQLGGGTRGVVVTGPNTGGKTVALKTVGLLSVMAQSGLHVPAGEGTVLCLNSAVLCDVGDGQSITENLSTFSAHMSRVIGILARADADSLVLLDELGSGTDPAEGMGLAVAVLEELRGRGCLFVCTTHYPEVKEYAAAAPGVTNARMAFDRATLRPLYRLELGEAGESCALYIAERLGLPRPLLERARAEAYREAPAPGGPREPLPEVPPPLARSALRREAPAAPSATELGGFVRGDSVRVSPSGETGIVFLPADERGEAVVQVKGEKRRVSYKRLTLLAPASELYPPDYDFSIVFDTVENRKARHQMGKGHQPGLVVRVETE